MFLSLLFGTLNFLLSLYLLVMFGRFILDWVQAVSRGWRPRGAMVVVAEIVYTITDPPVFLSLLFGTLNFLLSLYLLVMFGRFILDWVQAVSRGWRPRGAMVVVAEIVYTITDPPIKLVRRFVKPIRIGAIQLDLAFTIVIFAVLIVRSVVLPTIYAALV